MKKLIRLALLTGIVAVGSATTAFGQKFGYINFQELVTLMPERDSVQVKLQKLEADYTSMLELMQVEFNNKLNDFQKNSATYTDVMRQSKEQELQDLQTRIQERYSTASQDIEQQSNTMIAPVIEKAEIAVKKVGKDNGFLIIFDESTRPMAYYDEANLTNILPLAKKELGIK